MNHEAACAETALELAQIDPSRSRHACARIDEQLSEIDGAVTEAQARIAELSERIRHRTKNGPDKGRVAEALLARRSVTEAEPGPELLAEEIETTKAGLRGLRERREDLQDERSRVEAGLRAEIAVAFAPAIGALRIQAGETINRLMNIASTVGAIVELVRATEAVDLASGLNAVRNAALSERLGDPGSSLVDPTFRGLLEAARALAAMPQAPRRPIAAAQSVSNVGQRSGPIPTAI